MKQLFLFSILLFFSVNVFSQSTVKLEGKYISKKRYSDIWTLVLNSDSTYIFDSKVGESILPGKWTIKDKKLVLTYFYKDNEYSYFFAIKIKKGEIKFKGKTKPFRGMKLNT